MKLDKSVEPLAKDSHADRAPALGARPQVRPADARARPRRPIARATRSRSKFAGQPVEFDDLLNTFDAEDAADLAAGADGYGDALAGRGQSINLAIEALNPFLQHLTPVMNEPVGPVARS